LTDFPERYKDLVHSGSRCELKREGEAPVSSSRCLPPTSAVYLYDSVSKERKIVEVEKVALRKRDVIIKLKGVNTPEDASILKGKLIQVDYGGLYPLPVGYYYIFQLIGSLVLTSKGEEVGRLKEVLKLPANDVFVVEENGGGEFCIPAVSEFILEINTKERKIIVDLTNFR